MESDAIEQREDDRWQSFHIWVIGGLSTILILIMSSVVTWYVGGVSDRHEGFQRQLNAIHETLALRGERITRLEARIEECERQKK